MQNGKEEVMEFVPLSRLHSMLLKDDTLITFFHRMLLAGNVIRYNLNKIHVFLGYVWLQYWMIFFLTLLPVEMEKITSMTTVR